MWQLGMKDFNPCLLVGTAMTLSLSGQAVTRRFRDQNGQRVVKSFTRPQLFDAYYRFRHAVDDNNNVRQGLPT